MDSLKDCVEFSWRSRQSSYVIYLDSSLRPRSLSDLDSASASNRSGGTAAPLPLPNIAVSASTPYVDTILPCLESLPILGGTAAVTTWPTAAPRFPLLDCVRLQFLSSLYFFPRGRSPSTVKTQQALISLFGRNTIERISNIRQLSTCANHRLLSCMHQQGQAACIARYQHARPVTAAEKIGVAG